LTSFSFSFFLFFFFGTNRTRLLQRMEVINIAQSASASLENPIY
jgi:hypothetical protein